MILGSWILVLARRQRHNEYEISESCKDLGF